jgi:hypothetical protein
LSPQGAQKDRSRPPPARRCSQGIRLSPADRQFLLRGHHVKGAIEAGRVSGSEKRLRIGRRSSEAPWKCEL